MSENLSAETIVGQKMKAAYRNKNLTPEKRTADLLSRMTLEEKIAQMICIWAQKKIYLFDAGGKLNTAALKLHFKNGLGQIARLSDSNNGLTAVQMAQTANEIQKFFIEETDLGIPVIIHEECLHGLVAKEATSYPQPIGLASTFNPDLVREIFSAIAEDARSRGAHQALAPVLDVARDPRWGRVEETFGEDPFLIAQLGTAVIKGLQGDGTYRDKTRVIATLKHFAAHGQPESGTNCAPVNVSERLLRDTFLFPFKEVIRQSNPLSVMPSYNEIDGVPSHANRWLLHKILRDEWGYEGFVVSDYFAITELNYREDTFGHAVAHDKNEAALLAARAGVNIELPDNDCYDSLNELVHEGLLEESVIDELVAKLLLYKFKIGLFDDPYVDPEQLKVEQKLDRDRPVALQAAREVVTLLKNDGNLLPLDIKSVGTLAVIGPNADRVMLGGYSGNPAYYTTVLAGIKQKAGKTSNILFSEGCRVTIGGSWNEDSVTFADPEENRKLISDAVATAGKADLVVLVVGDNEQTSREAWSKVHLGDRAHLGLFGMQNDLVEAIVKTGKPVVVVLFNGRPNAIPYIEQHVPAILECWYLGQESGRAVADVLFGDFNPSGKLPISIPRSVGHIPCFYNRKPSALRGYLDDDHNPLYPFGYGLSYTTFSFSDIKLEKPVIRNGESTLLSVNVMNNGKRSGHEVVQMYIRDLYSSVSRPVKELKGFRKVFLKPGQSETVKFEIKAEHLAFTNIDMEYVVEPGEFAIMVGNSSRDEDLGKIILEVK